MKNDFKKILDSMKGIYDKYLYVVAKPVIILLFLVILFEIISFIVGRAANISVGIFELIFPFVLGILISLFLEPVNKFLEKKFKFKRTIAVVTSLVLSIVIILGFFTVILYFAISQSIVFIDKIVIFLQNYNYKEGLNSLESFVNSGLLTQYISLEQMSDLLVQFKDNLAATLDSLGEKLSILGKSFVSFLSGIFIHFIPTFIFVFFISIITSFFISKDKDKVKRLVQEYTPEKFYNNVMKVKTKLVENLLSYFKGHVILVFIESTVIFIGLLVMGSPYAITFYLICLVLGNVPVVGQFILLVPYAIYSLVQGDMFGFYTIIAISILFSLVRPLLEPKILGGSLGIHPLLFLVAVYIGLEAFGGIGMLMGPFALVFLKILFDTEIIKINKVRVLTNEDEVDK